MNYRDVLGLLQENSPLLTRLIISRQGGEEEEERTRPRFMHPLGWIYVQDFVDDAMTTEFCDALRQNIMLTEVCFYANVGANEMTRAIVKALGEMSRLRKLKIGGFVPSEMTICLLSQVRQVSEIEFVVENTISERDARRFACAIKGHSAVEKFELRFKDVDRNCQAIICEAMKTLLRLQELTATGGDFVVGPLFECKSVRKLTLYDCSIRSEELRALASSSVEECKIEYCTLRATELFDALSTNRHLKKLTVAGFDRGFTLDPSVFSIFSNRDDAEGLSINTTLVALHFHDAVEPVNVTENFVRGLRGFSALKELELPENCVWTTEAAAVSFRDWLANNGSLIKLVMGMMKLGDAPEGVESASWSTIAPSLSTNDTLEELEVHGSAVTLDCFALTAEALADNTSLKKILFCHRELAISPSVLIAVVRTLQNNKSLEEIRFGSWICFLTAEEGRSLLALMKAQYGLARIDDLKFEDATQERLLDRTLDLNRADRRYLIEEPSSVERGVHLLTKVKDNLDYVFYHLRHENPSLCECQRVAAVASGVKEEDDRKQSSNNKGAESSRDPKRRRCI